MIVYTRSEPGVVHKGLFETIWVASNFKEGREDIYGVDRAGSYQAIM